MFGVRMTVSTEECPMTTVLTNPSSGMCTEVELRRRLTEALLSDIVERVARESRRRGRPSSVTGAVIRGLVCRCAKTCTWVATWPTFQGTLLHSHDHATSAFRTVRAAC